MKELNSKSVEFSIVVTGEHCNPSILNQDFLRIEKIVPDEWKWELRDPPIVTPPLSRVAYKSGIVVTVEPNRVQILDSNFDGVVENSKLVGIADRYIQTLPKVRYTGVGTNFKIFVEIDNPAHDLTSRFLKDKFLGDHTDGVNNISLKFGMPHRTAILNISFDSGHSVQQDKGVFAKKTGIVISGNFHRICGDYPSARLVQQHIAECDADYSDFKTILAELFGLSSKLTKGD